MSIIMILSYQAFDAENISGAPLGNSAKNKRMVGIWLVSVLCATLVMVLIGALTRLTDSGLSMVEWRPLMGVIPPMNEAEWHRIFALYQQIPEYQQFPIALPEFKRIFFWEYLHRLWGRGLG